MLIKVEGGTARNDENLCDTCQHATIARDAKGTKFTQCSTFNTMVRTRIVRCTAWIDHNHLSVWDMKEMAWILGRSSDAAGFRGSKDTRFKQYKKLSKEDKQDVDNDAMEF